MNAKSLSSYRNQDKSLLDDSSTGSQLPPRVSINANQFTLIDPSGNGTLVPSLRDGPCLDMIIVDRNIHMSKLYWGGKKYNPAETTPPVCFSDNGVAPSATAQEPQSPTCATCPHNVIGSAISPVSGARIKACGDLKKFAVIVKGFPGVYLFTVKPGSFKAWNNYNTMLRMQKLPDGGKPDLCDVVTRVRFTGQGVMSFEATEFPDAKLIAQVIDVWEKNKQHDLTGLMIGRFDQPAQGVLSGPRDGQAPRQTPPPPQEPLLSGEHPAGPLFPQPPTAQSAAAPQEPAAKGRGRAKKEGNAQPQASVSGIATPQTAPPDVAARLQSLFPK